MSSKNKDKKEIPLWAQLGHGRPVSRRELLASGVISFSAYLLLPSWISLVSSTAEAAATCSSGASGGGMIPFITLNLEGGAALQANFVPHDQGGQLLSNYDRMGLGNNSANLPIEREFGNVPFAGKKPGTNVLISQFLAGVRAQAPTALANTSFVAVCARMRDDTSENKLSTAGLISRAGVQGSLLPFLGTERSVTGVRQQAALVTPASPLVVPSFTALAGSVVPVSDLGNYLSSAQKTSLLSLVSKLTGSQVQKLANDQKGTETKNLLECANIRNEQVKSLIDAGAVAIDPRRDAKGAELSAVWGINATTQSNNENLVFGSIAYNVLVGNSGAAGLEMGSFDYHNNTRTTGDAQDFAAGQTVGRMLETAAILGKKLFIHVTTDGAVDSGDASNVTFEGSWTSDRGQASVSYIIYYDPAGRHPTSGFQIGHFLSGQIADETIPTGKAEGAALAVFGNYLKLNNRMDLYTSDASAILNATELTKAIKFA